MTRLITILILLIFVSCRQANEKSADTIIALDTNYMDQILKPFQLTLKNTDYSMASILQYVLTDKDFKIIFKGVLEGEKDSILFRTEIKSSKSLVKLSNINLDSLQSDYSNPCIQDGSQITITISKDNKSKTVHLSNYFQPDIGYAIEHINSLTPKKYQIWYDKVKLIRDQEMCK